MSRYKMHMIQEDNWWEMPCISHGLIDRFNVSKNISLRKTTGYAQW